MNDIPHQEVDPKRDKRQFLGDMHGTAVILGEIVSPVIDLEEIEAYRDQPSIENPNETEF